MALKTLYDYAKAKSHPTRGAWIEIWVESHLNSEDYVAPHTGCVD